MKTYREQYNDLHFSPEEKQAMVENLLAAVPETQKRVSHKKRLHVLIAAVIAAALCAACASGALQAAIQSLSFFLGNQPEQTQVLGEMAQPIGASVDDPAIINLTDFRFDEDLTTTEPEGMEDAMKDRNVVSGSGWGPRFASILPGENAIHFMEASNWPTLNGMRGLATATFTNLRAKTVSIEIPEEDLCLEGNWVVDFQIDYKDASRYLPTGQVFHSNSKRDNVLTGTIEEFRLSPLSLKITYAFTVDETKLEKLYPYPDKTYANIPGYREDWLFNATADTLLDVPVILRFQDGTSEVLFYGGDLTDMREGKAIISDTFDKIIPLNTLESISIGDLTVEVPE